MAACAPPSAWAQAAVPAKPATPASIEADSISARPDMDVIAEGNAQFRQDGTEIRADRLSYDQTGDIARAKGNVKILRDGNRYSGPELQLQVQRFEGYFINPTYFFSKTNAGGTAARMDFLGEQNLVATGANYTSCPMDGSSDPAWLLSTDSVKLDFEHNEGIAKGAVLRFYGVPILAAPTLSFPLTDDRKSGWLPPTTSIDNKNGFQLAVPYYWNIAPNRDATLTPTVITRRGVGLGSEFRYLEPNYEGVAKLNVLAYDSVTGESRGALNLKHEGTAFGDGFYKVRLARVSDDDYWKDFSRDYPSLTPRLLGSDVAGTKSFGNWTTYARVQRWQVLQNTDAESLIRQSPYDRLPQIGVRGTEKLLGGLELSLENEFNRFTNPTGNIEPNRLTGTRIHSIGALSLPYVTPGWTLVPKLSVNAAAYSLDQPVTQGQYAGRSQFGRTIPTFSLDSAWVLERDTKWFGQAARQTLEPRLLFVRTPYRDQSGVPQFDSAGKDFNFDSIYTENSFTGVDRVSDAYQVTAGVTTRILDEQTGAEAMKLGIAQRFLRADQQITPDGTPITNRVSDLLLLGSTNLIPKWTLNGGLQYSPDLHAAVRSLFGVRYSPGPYRTVNVGYRLKRGDSEQVEVGWQWPIYGRPKEARSASATGGSCSGSWYSVGYVKYSMGDSRIVDAVAGFEYDAGCWNARVVAKRFSTSPQEANTQLGFEIEFVGLSRLGTNPLQVLKDNIPGYRQLRDDRAAPIAP